MSIPFFPFSFLESLLFALYTVLRFVITSFIQFITFSEVRSKNISSMISLRFFCLFAFVYLTCDAYIVDYGPVVKATKGKNKKLNFSFSLLFKISTNINILIYSENYQVKFGQDRKVKRAQ